MHPIQISCHEFVATSEFQLDVQKRTDWESEYSCAGIRFLGDHRQKLSQFFDLRVDIRFAREQARKKFLELASHVRAGSGAWVEVRRMGAGRTEKSEKVRVEGVTVKVYRGPGEIERQRAGTSTITIPVSQIIELDGKTYASRWCVVGTLKKRSVTPWEARRDYKVSVSVPSVWLEQEQLWESVFLPLVLRIEEHHAQDEARREAARREKAAVAAELAAAEAARAEAVQREREQERARKEKRAQRHQQRLAEMETYGPCRVEWDEWKKVNLKRGGARREKETYEAEDVLVKVSGNRAYLIFSDGVELIKSVDNVRWERQQQAAS